MVAFRGYKNLIVMLDFIKKNWFYIGLSVLALVYFRKQILGSLHIGREASTEKIIQKAGGGEGESLFGFTPGPSVPPAGEIPEIPAAEAKVFLKRFAKVVQGEQAKYHIPASVLLALAYVNSHAGTRVLATSANNFYGLPCGISWNGSTTDINGTCFRQYETAWLSFRDASQSISATRWAQQLIQSKGKNQDQWIDAFKANGYCDGEKSSAEMKRIIKAYRLFELD